MADPYEHRALALAGVFQAAGLVREIARDGGLHHEEAAATSIASIFATEPDSVEAVFGGKAGLRMGLGLLRGQLRSGETREPELARYVIGLTVLERKLAQRPGVLAQLGEDIEGARRTYDHFGPRHANVAGRLADIYSHRVSNLGSRIVVRGSSESLSDPDNVARVRALLLAGLRAAFLWRHQGGRRWELVLRRGRYLARTEELLASHSVAP